LEGRLDEAQLRRFRQEVRGGGLSSYPHPWLMPDFWQFLTVSVGLGPMMAIFQARFVRYMEHRGTGKIIQELEAAFLGAGWNVIKVLWGSGWDPLLERDQKERTIDHGGRV
jgi:pyruvate dehydrogenase E1 component